MAISPALRGISLILPRVDARGRLVAAYSQVRLTPPVVGSYRQDFGSPRKGGISQSSTCICLPAEA